MSTPKTFKKGEVIYRDGDKINFVYLIQSGGINQCILRPKKNVDMFQLGPNHVVGEQILLGQATHSISAIASAETKVLEFPIELFKQHYEGTSNVMKVLIKSLSERLKTATNEVKSSKLEKDSSPLPEDHVARAFGSFFHTVNHKGEKQKDGSIVVPWVTVKQYAQRVFGESPKRIEQTATLLKKLGFVKFEMGVPPENPDGPEELQAIEVKNMNLIEAFFEFYQYYYFKGGKTELLRYDDYACMFVEGFMKLVAGQTPDRFGVVSVDFLTAVDHFKNECNANLSVDQLGRLEQKGVYFKRVNVDNKAQLQFEFKEIQNILATWKIIREIDKWNEKGYVDEGYIDVRNFKKAPAGPSCPSCHTTVIENAKFCPECGTKLSGTNAA